MGLREEIAELRVEQHASDSPAWSQWRSRVAELVLKNDPRAFLGWKPVMKTMFTPNWPASVTELRALQATPEWSTFWGPAVVEDPTGCPPPLPALAQSSSNLVHHAYHVHRLKQATGQSLADFSQIVELGGGYGSFARLAFRLGFTGRYYVYDFPEFAALQRYFVASVAEHRGDRTIAERFVATSERSALPQIDPDRGLFVALWSLSEMPVEQRESWVEFIGGSSAVLMAFQHEFEESDNRAWFSDLQRRLPQLEWAVEEIEQIPGNAYIFGQR